MIPLDMVFADKTGLVTRVHANALPLDPTPIPGGEEIMYVLEINGGVAESFGINAGSTLRHPTIEQSNAVWPCSRD